MHYKEKNIKFTEKYQKILNDIKDNDNEMVGIIFAHPSHKVVKNEILPFLNQMNICSGNYIDFHFAGYIEKNEKKNYKNVIKIKQKISKHHIYFSEYLFYEMRRNIEKSTKWNHSGGIDFLLINVQRKDNDAKLNFSNCIEIELGTARENKNIPILNIFFESIFKYAHENGGKTSKYSNNQIPNLAVNTFEKLLNKSFFSLYERGKIYAIKDLSKN